MMVAGHELQERQLRRAGVDQPLPPHLQRLRLAMGEALRFVALDDDSTWDLPPDEWDQGPQLPAGRAPPDEDP